MAELSGTFRVGGLEVAALSDGAPERELSGFFDGVDAADWTAALGISSPDDPVPFNFGVFLVRGDGHTTLVDAGYGAQGARDGHPRRRRAAHPHWGVRRRLRRGGHDRDHAPARRSLRLAGER